jgi:hypothetical protein
MPTELEELLAKRNQIVRDMNALMQGSPDAATMKTYWLLDEQQAELAQQIRDAGGEIEDTDDDGQAAT